MRVVCENCGATYKIPESKLAKEVNKATCRKCGFRMMIRRPAAAAAASASAPVPSGEAATQVTSNPLNKKPDERELLEANTRIQKDAVTEWSDEAPTQVQVDPLASPPPGPAKAPVKTRAAAQPTGDAGRAPSDMLLALFGTFAAAAGPMLLATNTADAASQRMIGLFVALWGALTCLFLLVTGNLWRQKGNIPISIALATVLSVGGTAFVELAMHDDAKLPVAEKPDVAEPSETPASDDGAQDALADNEAAEAPEAAEAAEASEEVVADAVEDTPPPAARPSAPPPPEPARQARPEPAVDDEESLDDADFDEIPVSATQSDAEERRRREMEEAAARARAEREARQAEKARRARETQKARPAAPPASTGTPKMKSLPLTVVDTMIRSNMSVKRCFFAEKQEAGSLPSRVNVRFTVMPTGRVSSARVTTDQYKGSTLDSCLGRSFKAIKFPAFEGDPLSMTYPFIL